MSDDAPPRTPGWTLPRLLAVAALLLVVAMWISSGSLAMALVTLVLVGGLAGLGLLVCSWVARGPRPGDDELPAELPAALPTTDLDHVPGPADRVRRTLRGLLARPWVRGDALVRAATARLASEDALVFTPRGQRVAAPHLWVEWNTADLAEVARRWPLDVLARELVDGYVERTGDGGVRRLADRTWLHLLAGPDVPVGRVVVTAAFSRPQRTPAVSACAPDVPPPARRRAENQPAVNQPGAPAGVQHQQRRPLVPPRPVPAIAAAQTTSVATTDTTAVTTTVTPRAQAGRNGGGNDGNAVWRRVLPSLRTIRAPRRPRPPETVGVLVAETPGAADVVLGARVTIGRDPHADAVVDHPGVSWHHLTIERRDPATWLVTDAGSTNGTEIGGTRITAPTPLRPGDVLGLGHDGPHYRLALRSTGPVPDTDVRAPHRTRVEVT